MRQTPTRFVREAYEAIEALSRQSTTDGVLDAMQRALTRFGFAHFHFTTFPDSKQRCEDITLASRLPNEWSKIYAAEQYAQVSPAVRHCRQTHTPFKFKDAPYDPEREPRVVEYLRRITDFGLSDALIFPISGPQGSIGGVWMCGRADEVSDKDMPLLHLVALYAFERVRKLYVSPSRGGARLTARERDVLAWAAEGKSAWEIGEILGIAKRTVDEHVQSACRKLNAVNRTQAVVAALREQFIAL